jgi:hypothetical protein
MRCCSIGAGLAMVLSLHFLPMKAKAEDLSLKLAGETMAFREMIVSVLSGQFGEAPKDFCLGLRVSPEPVDRPGLADLPEATLVKLQEEMKGDAELHSASQCVIFGPAAAFKGREAVLLSYWDVDTDINAILAFRGIDVPDTPLRLSFEPNRMAPVIRPPSPLIAIRPDGRMRWDGYGQVADSCGPRYYDFAGDASDVRILDVMQHPQVCD